MDAAPLCRARSPSNASPSEALIMVTAAQANSPRATRMPARAPSAIDADVTAFAETRILASPRASSARPASTAEQRPLGRSVDGRGGPACPIPTKPSRARPSMSAPCEGRDRRILASGLQSRSRAGYRTADPWSGTRLQLTVDCNGDSPPATWRRHRMWRSICSRSPRSSRSQNEMAQPVAPARPVRPMRCT